MGFTGFLGTKTGRSLAAPPDENVPSPEDRAAMNAMMATNAGRAFDPREWQHHAETGGFVNTRTGELLSEEDFDFEAILAENTDVFHPDDDDRDEYGEF